MHTGNYEGTIDYMWTYRLIDEICNQQVYFYGHQPVSCGDKKKIILFTIKYIKETRSVPFSFLFVL